MFGWEHCHRQMHMMVVVDAVACWVGEAAIAGYSCRC
jgi:hypothetical protein